MRLRESERDEARNRIALRGSRDPQLLEVQQLPYRWPICLLTRVYFCGFLNGTGQKDRSGSIHGNFGVLAGVKCHSLLGPFTVKSANGSVPIKNVAIK